MIMRRLHLLPPSLLIILSTPISAFEIPYPTSLSLQDFTSPAFGTNVTAASAFPTPAHANDLRRRQGNSCPNDFHACSNLGAPGLCCANAAVCTPDANGNPACCPSGVVCTGSVNGAISSGTVNSDGSLVTGGTATGDGGGSGGTTSFGSASTAQRTTTGGVVIQSNTASSRAVVIGGGGGNAGSGAPRGMEVPRVAKVIQGLLNVLRL